jgi:hypothetical protein
MQRKIAPAMLVLLCAAMASASVTTSTFVANGTSTGGDAVDAKAVFSFNNMNDQLTVTLTNLLANPSSVAQDITDFGFQLQTSAGTISCNSNCLMPYAPFTTTILGTVTVNPGGSYTVNPTNAVPGWAVTGGSGGFTLNALAGNSIIGPPGSAGYTNAKSTITGINQSAQWTFLLAGLPNLSTTTVTPTHVVFSFGTTAGDLFSCDSTANDCAGLGFTPTSTPEPWTFVLAGTGLVGIYFIRRRRPGPR